jgi:hypothetical protein
MPETAVPCDPVPQVAVPVPRKMPVPEAWKLAECLVPFRADAVAVSTTFSMIWISVTRWMGCTMIVVCMSMTTGEAITKQIQLSDQRHCAFKTKSFYTRYLPAIPVATEPVGVASARLPFLCFSVPSPMVPAPGLGS